MAYSKIENFALKISEEIVKAHGYGIYDVEYVKEGPHWFLRIYIENESGVNLDDCEKISRAVSDRLDKDDIIKNNYYLEVSSPGLERSLRQSRHFEDALGEKVRVRLKNGSESTGVLTSHTSESITLDGNMIIQKKDISKANVVFEFTL